MTHRLDHPPDWHTPIDNTGHPTGPTVCHICGVEIAMIICETCGQSVEEYTISHGPLGRLHRVPNRVPQ